MFRSWSIFISCCFFNETRKHKKLVMHIPKVKHAKKMRQNKLPKVNHGYIKGRRKTPEATTKHAAIVNGCKIIMLLSIKLFPIQVNAHSFIQIHVICFVLYFYTFTACSSRPIIVDPSNLHSDPCYNVITIVPNLSKPIYGRIWTTSTYHSWLTPKLWLRYVYDTFVLWPHSIHDLDQGFPTFFGYCPPKLS